MPAAYSPRPDRLALLGVGAVLVALTLVALAADSAPEWARTRDDVRGVVGDRVGAEKAAAISKELEQIWLPEANRVDRCMACHAAIDGGPELVSAPNPARSHPRPELLAAHPIETFGCTLCHGGQGAATTKAAAHGDVAHWDEPMLGARLAKKYGITPAELMEVNCNVCHRRDAKTDGMPLLAEAKALVLSKRCVSCHRIDGRGATAGPELSREGEKPAERFAFPAGWRGPRTALEWHTRHLLDPAAIVPNSEMKNFEFSEREAKALALLVMSWRRASLPASLLPDPGRAATRK